MFMKLSNIEKIMQHDLTYFMWQNKLLYAGPNILKGGRKILTSMCETHCHVSNISYIE